MTWKAFLKGDVFGLKKDDGSDRPFAVRAYVHAAGCEQFLKLGAYSVENAVAPARAYVRKAFRALKPGITSYDYALMFLWADEGDLIAEVVGARVYPENSPTRTGPNGEEIVTPVPWADLEVGFTPAFVVNGEVEAIRFGPGARDYICCDGVFLWGQEESVYRQKMARNLGEYLDCGPAMGIDKGPVVGEKLVSSFVLR